MVDLAGRDASSLLARRRGLLAAVAIGGLFVVPLLVWADVSALARDVGTRLERLLPLTLTAVVAFAAILVLERCMPADRSQSSLSRGFCQDVVWLLLAAPFAIFGAFALNRAVEWVFEHPLAGGRFDLGRYLPFTAVVVICFVIGDGLAWFSHYLKHRVPLLWRFHMVHHSATEINCFTDGREHVVEYCVNRLVFVLPFFVIGGDISSTVLLLALGRMWYSRFVHANIRTNLGPLSHVLVTPQYHRTHHSVEARHVDRNLGSVLTIWDRLFRTHVADHDCYPKTGVNDPFFPQTTSRSPITLLRTYGQQWIYPFRRAAARYPAG